MTAEDPPSSPSSSRISLVRSYTTSSLTSADERIAAARAAREQRRREREKDGEEAVPEADEDAGRRRSLEQGDVPSVSVLEARLDEQGEPHTPSRLAPSGDDNDQTSLIPRLRVKSTSDRSFAPSVPSTPSQTASSSSPSKPSPSDSPAVGPRPLSVAHDPSSSPLPSLLTGVRRPSIEIVEIPPFRPKTASPAPALPEPASPARTPSPVVGSAGLIERLKQQRAAKVAVEQREKEKEKAVEATPASASVENKVPTISRRVDGAGDEPLKAQSSESVGAGSANPPFAIPVGATPPLAVNPPSSSSPPPPLPPASASPVASPPTRDSVLSPDPTSSGAGERDDVLPPLPIVPRGSPPRGRRTQASKVFGRNGEEIDYDFTELSDVQEQSERSSLSTWRDSIHKHRRFGSTSTTGRPPSSISPTLPTFSINPYRFSYQSSTSREPADGSYASSGQRQPPSSSAASVKSDSSQRPRHGRSQSEVFGALSHGFDEPRERIDATAQLLGRSGSSGSIFSGMLSSSRNSIRLSSLSPLSIPPSSPPQSDVSRRSSPVRRVSPEVARRVEQFGGEEGWVSPTKSAFSSVQPGARSPKKGPSTDDAASIASTLSLAPSCVAKEVAEQEDEDPLVAIERRRAQRRQDLELFQLTFGQTEPMVSPPTFGFPQTQRKAEEEKVAGAASTFSSRSGGEEAVVERTGGSVVERHFAKPGRDEGTTKASALSISSKTDSIPPSPRVGPLCEGYLRVPPSDALLPADSLSRPQDWIRRYCVLTAESLDFRPTDHNLQPRPIVAFSLAECKEVEDVPDVTIGGTFRPFAVVLRDGERLLFACESRRERVAWVVALQDAVEAAQRSRLRVLTHPATSASLPNLVEASKLLNSGSLPSSASLPSVKAWASGSDGKKSGGSGRREEEKVKTKFDRPWSNSYVDHVGAGARPASPWSSLASRVSPPLVEPPKSTPLYGNDRDLFAYYGRRPPLPSPAPSSVHSSGSNRPLPPVPPTLATASPLPALSRSTRLFESSGHRRARSDLSGYATPPDQPPFRPIPTRPESLRSPIPNEVFSPSSMLPARPSTRSPWSSGASYLSNGVDARQAAEEKELQARLTTNIDDLLRQPHQPTQQDSPFSSSPSSVRTVKAGRAYDQATFTTRAGVHTASEKLDWQRDLRRFEVEAQQASSPQHNFATPPQPSLAASSVASPETKFHARETASRKLEGRSPIPSLETIRRERAETSRKLEGRRPPPAASSLIDEIPVWNGGGGSYWIRGKDPFAGSAVVEPPRMKTVQPPQDVETTVPISSQQSSAVSLRPYNEWNPAQSVSSSQARDALLEESVMRLLSNLDRHEGAEERNKQHQDRMAQVVGGLAMWVAEDRQLREKQHGDLASAINGVAEHVAELPQRLLAFLQANKGGLSATPVQVPTTDTAVEVEEEGDEFVDASSSVGGEAAGGDGRMGTVGRKTPFGLNPKSSFAQLDRKLAETGDGKGGGSKLKGPRMPGIRLWGAPTPSADRAGRWGTRPIGDPAHDHDDESVEGEQKENLPHGPVVDALKKDERLGAALEAIAAGEGDEIDAGTLSLAVFEILQSMREIQAKQRAAEERREAEKASHNGLTASEAAALDAKKAEIARLEKGMSMTADRTAHINELVAQLAERTNKADDLLAKIAKDVEAGKTTTMDPKLSEEVKTLLGGVRAGVDDHVKDFRGQITSEVQRMFKEVGKLRDEKKILQADIAELMAFQAKQGGAVPKSVPPPPPAAFAAAALPPPAPKPAKAPKPGMPSSGFFGPRPMK